MHCFTPDIQLKIFIFRHSKHGTTAYRSRPDNSSDANQQRPVHERRSNPRRHSQRLVRVARRRQDRRWNERLDGGLNVCAGGSVAAVARQAVEERRVRQLERRPEAECQVQGNAAPPTARAERKPEHPTLEEQHELRFTELYHSLFCSI